jgi:hypothetical protein
VQVTSAQYLVQKPLKELPQPIAQAGIAFEKDVTRVMRSMANEVGGKVADPAPNIRESEARLRDEMERHYRSEGRPIPSQPSDVLKLAESLASILAPLYQDIHATFADRSEAVENEHLASARPTESSLGAGA